ncbi:hypothetical protein BBD41_15405 [Paenibacillus ihbetae]|uniref:Uncharacterized protein n=1 Tax=Paenibacillus ihbetae TaxID=1870820 RepID=A0A1B2E1L5_9BACL|nr:hypothetical protein [Paenibacillus ihbetae]ANY73853.1 hypothetical protein BBD41_15405 [Paenibacillus ihbetae]
MPTKDHLTITVEKGNHRYSLTSPLGGIERFTVVVNDQFTNAPNTTQIASGAGKSSAAGNNAAIRSPFTYQQESVGAGGIAKNLGLKNSLHHGAKPDGKIPKSKKHQKEVVFVINKQVVRLPRSGRDSSATQIASGAGAFSTGGTNSAIESRGTRQQQAVGGGSGSKAINRDARRKKIRSKYRSHHG